MNPYEVRTVRHWLEMYLDLLAMAKEKDREALLLQVKYEELATPGCIRYDREPGGSGSGRSKDSIYCEIFDRQREADLKAAKYRHEANMIMEFIDKIEDDDQEILKMAYLEGRRYWEIGKEIGYTKEGVHKKISRCLERVPSSIAEASGLL